MNYEVWLLIYVEVPERPEQRDTKSVSRRHFGTVVYAGRDSIQNGVWSGHLVYCVRLDRKQTMSQCGDNQVNTSEHKQINAWRVRYAANKTLQFEICTRMRIWQHKTYVDLMCWIFWGIMCPNCDSTYR
jgi:hypothetical protein